MANLQVCFVRKEPPDTTHRPKMANPISSMDFLKRKAEELRSKGTRRVMGSHPVPGTTPRREAEEPPRKRLRMGGEEEQEEQNSVKGKVIETYVFTFFKLKFWIC